MTGFDTNVYEIQLDDYNGEYGDFLGSAKKLNDSWNRYQADEDDRLAAGGTGTNGTGQNLWAMLPRLEVIHQPWVDDEGNKGADSLDSGDCCDRWTLRGNGTGLEHLYHELLQELATPAWHWYGMGGDDHAFDYWPNGMAMAVQLRDQLTKLGVLTDYPDEEGDLDRVYWLVRLRWESDQKRTASGHEYPGSFDDFLSADEFGINDTGLTA